MMGFYEDYEKLKPVFHGDYEKKKSGILEDSKKSPKNGFLTPLGFQKKKDTLFEDSIFFCLGLHGILGILLKKNRFWAYLQPW